MLVLSRKKNESVVITMPDGQQVMVVTVEIRGDKVRLGFDADPSIKIHRFEVQRAIESKGSDHVR